jgi:hypothetical protein
MNEFITREFQGIQSQILMNNLLTEEQLERLVFAIMNIKKSEIFKLEKLEQVHRKLQFKSSLNHLGTLTGGVIPAFDNMQVYSMVHEDGETRYYAMDDRDGIPHLMGAYEWIPEHVERV